MQIVKPTIAIVNPIPYSDMLYTTELAIRNCYQSQDKMTDSSAEGIIRMIRDSKHEAMLEFADIAVHIITDIGVLKQLTRHRLCSFAVMSTRYCNLAKDKFNNEIKVIVPEGLTNDAYEHWYASMVASEAAYMVMIKDDKVPAEVARSVLPHSLATSIYMKANIREWRNIFRLRALDTHAQKDVRLLMQDLLVQCYGMYPVFFEDLYNEYKSMQH